ncbi:hypothetical protein [Methylobacterium sp. E-016]|uniref:VpaChn25_0724 family phage protein n=1 Tax=Methylobacterium sp. E-016 TaxID=2836556 RepID=UPI001FB8B840|nr:hypothetical protein [Methylobacterium sp. E-016]
MISNAAPGEVSEIIAGHRALAVLRILIGEDCHGSSNDGALADVLDAFGLGCARATLRQCLSHLEHSGLLTLATVDSIVVVRLTRNGAEVAEGKATAEGVRPFVAGGPY